MAKLDGVFRPLAKKLLTEFGKVMMLKSTKSSDYSTATRTTSVHYVNYAFRGLIEDPSREDLSSGIAHVGDRIVMADALTLGAETPKGGDLLVIDQQEWKVLSVMSTFSGDLVALYRIVVRK